MTLAENTKVVITITKKWVTVVTIKIRLNLQNKKVFKKIKFKKVKFRKPKNRNLTGPPPDLVVLSR